MPIIRHPHEDIKDDDDLDDDYDDDLARKSVDEQATGVSCPGELSTVTEANQRWRHTQHTTYRSHLGAIQALPLETHINRLPKRAKRKPVDPTEPKNHPLGNI